MTKIKVKFNDKIYSVNQIDLTDNQEEFFKQLHV